MTETGLAAWLRRLESLHPKAVDLGLERVRAVAQRMELVPARVPVISIAGTNGKGSVAAALEAVLIAAGWCPGVTTSPHLQRFNERIRVAGLEMEDETIVAAFAAIERARAEISLTYFEFGLLAALWVFRERGVDVLVLEVGLGGRLDAVNIVDADVAVITAIGLDHQHWLGDSRDAIGREKAGILRSGATAVIADPAPPQGLQAAVAASGARALYLGRDFHCMAHYEGWDATLATGDVEPLAVSGVPRGPLLPENLCAALQAAQSLGVALCGLDLPGVLGALQVPGRRQQMSVGGCEYILDVAHNPQAIDKLREFLELSDCQGKTIALFSAMEDKPIHAMLQALGGCFEAWFLADQPDNPRAATAAAIADLLRGQGEYMISVSKNLRQALRRAQSIMSDGDRLVIFGSFFTVGAVLPALEKDLHRVKG